MVVMLTHGLRFLSIEPMKPTNQNLSSVNTNTRHTSPTEIATAVSEHPFLRGMAAAHMDLLSKAGTLVDFQPGDLIFKQGDPAHRFYLILSGSVSLTHAGLKGNVAVQCLAKGDVLGWSWLFPPYAWHFNAMVTESSRAIAFDAESVRALCDQNHELGYELMKRISNVVIDRLQKTRQKLSKLSG